MNRFWCDVSLPLIPYLRMLHQADESILGMFCLLSDRNQISAQLIGSLVDWPEELALPPSLRMGSPLSFLNTFF